MLGQLVYRPAEANDASAIQQVIYEGRRKTWGDLGHSYYEWLNQDMGTRGAKKLVRHMRQSNYLCRVAEQVGRGIVGVLISHVEGEDRRLSDEVIIPAGVCEMESLYVDDDMQGKGIGSRLLASHLEWADKRSTGLVVVQNNEPAIGIYTAFGFKEHAIFDWPFNKPWEDLNLPCIYMFNGGGER